MEPQSSSDVGKIISDIVTEGQRLEMKESNARETLIVQARRLIAALETPMENLLWTMCAEVCL